MRFSILIPVYNVEKYLSQCLDSVVNQSFDDYEIIVIDDGSTDKSSLICDDYQSRYSEKIKVIHKTNQGLIAARRDAINRSKGEYCVFVDSDDFVENILLETINNYLNKSNDIDIAIYKYNYFSNNHVLKESDSVAEDAFFWHGETKKELFNKLITSDVIDAIFIKAIRTDLLKRDPINYADYYGKNMSEDVLQSIYPIIYANRIVYISIPLYNYRYNENSISHNYSSASILKKDSTHVFYEILNALPILSLDDETKKKVYARWFSDVLYIFNKSCQNAKKLNTWSEIFNTPWYLMLPDLSIAYFQNFVNPFYIELYNDYINKRFFKIIIRFKINAFVKNIRLIKKKLLSKG